MILAIVAVMTKPRLTIVVLPQPTRRTVTGWGHAVDLIVRSDAGRENVFTSWDTLMKLMEHDSQEYRLSIRAAKSLRPWGAK
jgi:hypothetical protein